MPKAMIQNYKKIFLNKVNTAIDQARNARQEGYDALQRRVA